MILQSTQIACENRALVAESGFVYCRRAVRCVQLWSGVVQAVRSTMTSDEKQESRFVTEESAEETVTHTRFQKKRRDSP